MTDKKETLICGNCKGNVSSQVVNKVKGVRWMFHCENCGVDVFVSGRTYQVAESAFRKATNADKQGVCIWEWDTFQECYDTSCNKACSMLAGTPEENGYKFCPFCGKEVKTLPEKS